MVNIGVKEVAEAVSAALFLSLSVLLLPAQRIAFNREQRMFKVRAVCFLEVCRGAGCDRDDGEGPGLMSWVFVFLTVFLNRDLAVGLLQMQ